MRLTCASGVAAGDVEPKCPIDQHVRRPREEATTKADPSPGTSPNSGADASKALSVFVGYPSVFHKI